MIDPRTRALSRNTPTRLYIIHDARGTTVCCDGTMNAMMRESARALLIAPLTIHDWTLTDRPTMHGGWVKVQEFTWPSKWKCGACADTKILRDVRNDTATRCPHCA